MVDRMVAAIVWVVVLTVTSVFLWMVGSIFVQGWERLSLSFLFESPSDFGRGGGIASILVSTLMILLVCITVSVPLAMATAIMLNEYLDGDSWYGKVVRRSMDTLAGVPSIVFGLFGNALFCTVLGMGFSILSGGLTLACMVLPLLVRTIERGLAEVPDEYRFASEALGFRGSTTLLFVVMPAAVPALLTGLVLGIGRALSETAALIFTSGYVDRMPTSFLDSGRSLSIHIYDLSMNVAGGNPTAAASAILLIGVLLVINSTASLFSGYMSRNQTARP